MPKTIRMTFDPASIDNAIKQLQDYTSKLPDAADRIAQRLAEIGYQGAFMVMANHVFDGGTISSLTVTHEGDGKYILWAASEALLFLEFGTGLKAQGHPLAGEMGMGTGTYPGQTHATDPNGWWFYTDDVRLISGRGANGKTYGHSFGMPPAMPMYRASQEIRQDILRIAREVFAAL